jgi:RecA-family ATPase
MRAPRQLSDIDFEATRSAWDDELPRKANGDFRSQERNPAPSDYWADKEFTTICAFDLHCKPVPEREWLVDEVLPHRNVSLITGDGGLNKTLAALMLGVAVSTVRRWFGFNCIQGPFLFLGAEDETDEIHRRLDQIRLELNLSFEQLANFHFTSLVGDDPILAANDRGMMMKATTLCQKVEQRIKDIGAVACAIDTVADVFGGDENNRVQVRQFIGMLRGICIRQNCSIILLAHPSNAGMNSGSGISGSTGWHNSVRGRLYIEAVKDDDDARILTFKKNNYGPKRKPLNLRYQRGVLVVDDVAENKRTPQAADAMFLTMLDRYTEQGRNVSCNVGPTYAPSVFSNDKGCGFKSEELKDAMDRLMERKAIRSEQFGPPSKPRAKLVRIEVSN